MYLLLLIGNVGFFFGLMAIKFYYWFSIRHLTLRRNFIFDFCCMQMPGVGSKFFKTVRCEAVFNK